MTLDYLAGFFDGEGCVGLAKGPRGGFYPRAQIKQKNLRTLRCIKRDFGGEVYIGKAQPVSCTYWSGDAAYDLMAKLLPRLDGKRAQARIFGMSRSVPPKQREPFYWALRFMKRHAA